MTEVIADVDRLAMRGRPEGTPIMHQRWEKLLFMHWPISLDELRPHIPARLDIDTYNNQAWIGITPFTISQLNVTPIPPIPGLSSFHELNVRTYVHCDGIPGVWFLTLEASKLIPALAARMYFSLAYRKASMSYRRYGELLSFRSYRENDPPADFKAKWKPGVTLREPHIDSLAFFLTERYCLFSEHEGKICYSRIYHVPWILRDVEGLVYSSTMHSALGLPEPTALPVLHFAERQEVDIWAPQEL